MILSNEEIKALLEYFYKRAGYISHEFDPIVIEIIRRMENYVKENENK